ncbi:unnamed protein product [Aureobasidium mustum]|uniref:CCHC-type domain-containing protein n=1 Tax=Aureobasidium mustum TaxID=2773714 RepID=A0A9N8PPD3_9PEZI|nr:unnamed protein product [Aureobasidium mustum]
MPTRYETTPPWGKKRKREPSTSSNSTNKSTSPPPLPPSEQDSKHLSMENHDPRRRPTPWAKHSDPLSPSSLASDHDDLQQAARDMFDWTRSDRPIEESLAHMERIVQVCQDEASWSGDKRWKQVIATYRSYGASADAVQDLKDAREPFWTQCRVKHASSTIATPRALADSIRTMLAESERVNGHYLDRDIKDELVKAVERVFPRIQPRILIPDSPERPVSGFDQPQVPIPLAAPVAPVAQMLKIDTSSNRTPVPAAPDQALSAPLDPRLASRLPCWALASETKPRADSLAGSSSSRKSSAATFVISSPPSQLSPLPNPEPSQVIKPNRPSRFAPGVAESTNKHVQHAVPPSPSASPKPPTGPIQFNIATGSNQAPLKRPRLDLDVNLPPRPHSNVFSTPSSPNRRRSSTFNPSVQPPTGPRSLPLFQAKIIPKGPLLDKTRQKRSILEACDYNKIPAQDATPCPSDDRTWILHFRDLRDLQTSLGKMTILHDISIPVLTYAPGQSFQVFGIVEKPSFITPNVELDIINTVARTFRPAKFIMHRQKSHPNPRLTRRWLVIFEQPVDRDSFTLNLKINGYRETLDFSGLACSQDKNRCWVCNRDNHLAHECEFTDAVNLPHQDSQYLSTTPQLR